jgi:hypothetical protein
VSLFPPSINDSQGQTSSRDDLAGLRPAKLVLSPDGHVGEALRRARESLGLDVEDVAFATHVHSRYIAALEVMDLDALPARPFAVGYVKAYARALGLDQGAVVARFRGEAPGEEVRLRAPLGAQLRRQGSLGKLGIVVMAVIAGFASWNLFVRIRSAPTHVAAVALPTPARPKPGPGPLVLGAPLPAPPEATTPPPYETPGLAAATAATGPDTAAAAAAHIAAAAAAAKPADPIAVGAPLVPHGAVYGGGGGNVALLAIRPFSLVVRGAGGAVYFARQLSAGEAWRAPALAGLTIDVDDPPSAEAYVGGHAVGPLSERQSPVADIKAPAAPAG